MVRLLPLPDGPARFLRIGLALLLMVFSEGAYAQTTSDYAVADGVTIYLAVLPAEMVRTYPPGTEESRMHGGVPGGKHVHHVQVALFDARTGDRIVGATVSATVAELGLSGVRQVLEPFSVGDAQTYGGYFEFQRRSIYEVKVSAALPDGGPVVEKTFEYEHL